MAETAELKVQRLRLRRDALVKERADFLTSANKTLGMYDASISEADAILNEPTTEDVETGPGEITDTPRDSAPVERAGSARNKRRREQGRVAIEASAQPDDTGHNVPAA